MRTLPRGLPACGTLPRGPPASPGPPTDMHDCAQPFCRVDAAVNPFIVVVDAGQPVAVNPLLPFFSRCRQIIYHTIVCLIQSYQARARREAVASPSSDDVGRKPALSVASQPCPSRVSLVRREPQPPALSRPCIHTWPAPRQLRVLRGRSGPPSEETDSGPPSEETEGGGGGMLISPWTTAAG